MKKVLIIGNQGMLGRELLRLYGADKKYETIGWDLPEIDITDEEQVRAKVGQLAPRVIINAAAFNAVDKCAEVVGLEAARRLNGLAPRFLAQAANKLGAVFAHFSTDYVFDGERRMGYLESDKPFPISNYGFSKLMGEREVARVGGQYYIIRLQKLFGSPGLSPGAKKSFFEAMLEAAQTKRELEVVDEELANFTYAPDLAERTKYLIEHGFPEGIYHATNEGAPVTWYGAAEVLFETAGVKGVKLISVPASRFPRPAKRPRFSILLNSKTAPMRPWSEALAEFLGR